MIFPKITVFTALLSLTLLFSCNQEKLDQLEKQNQTLSEQAHEQDSLLSDFLATFNTFGENLEAIKERENIVAFESEDPELRKKGKDKIIADIEAIDELLSQNRLLIDDLQDKLEKSDAKTNQFRRMVTRLNKQLEERGQEIVALKQELVNKNFSIEELNIRVDTLNVLASNLTRRFDEQTARISSQEEKIGEQNDIIMEQTTELNTAYMISGSSKELKKKNVVTKTGGFIGIGGIKKMSSNFSDSVFTTIDITEVTMIPLSGKKAKLITNHPENSYVFNSSDKDLESLEIIDPEKFWKNTKYLVVETN
jgi:chromosome segregation ATPase